MCAGVAKHGSPLWSAMRPLRGMTARLASRSALDPRQAADDERKIVRCVSPDTSAAPDIAHFLAETQFLGQSLESGNAPQRLAFREALAALALVFLPGSG